MAGAYEHIWPRIKTMLGRKYNWLIWVAVCVSVGFLLAMAFVSILDNLTEPNKVTRQYDDNMLMLDETPAVVRNEGILEQETIQTTVSSDNRHEQEVIKRRNTLRHHCSQHTPTPSAMTDTRKRMLYSKHLNATMCYVPKTGCTAWKRIFLMADSENPGMISDIRHSDIHYAAMKSMLDVQRFDESFHVLSKSTKILFTREPFSRLFSVWVDKFYLSNFWVYGGNIIGFHRDNPKKIALKCGSDVSLTEFMKYVARSVHSPPFDGPQEHWISVNNLCHPCTFDYDIIGKQETFDDDRDYILSKLSKGDKRGYLKSKITLQSTFRNAIYLLVQKHWSMIQFGKPPCIDSEDYLRRIWTSLQYQGFLPSEAKFPAHFIGGGLFADLSMSKTTDTIYNATGVDSLTIDSWNARKHKMMSLMFRDISFEVKEALERFTNWTRNYSIMINDQIMFMDQPNCILSYT